MKKTDKNAGITLIVLAVTIIVLLILAGISIMMLTGDNGILKKAGEAKSTFIRRLIYAVVAFLIPFIVTLAFDLVASIVTNDGTDYPKILLAGIGLREFPVSNSVNTGNLYFFISLRVSF